MPDLSENKIPKEPNQLEKVICAQREYIWNNIFKIEALKKETILRKKQALCKNLQIKVD